eukprot:5146422-Amphidinium_carterae.1
MFCLMSRMRWLMASTNKLSGTVPQALQGPHMKNLFVGDNLLQGSLPQLSGLHSLLAENNLLAGTLPPSMLYTTIVAGMAHEGTVPACFGRLTVTNVSFVLGHGL